MPSSEHSISTLDLSPLPEADRLAFYGSLFSMSFADREMSESETDRIFQSLDLAHLSEDGRKEVFSYAVNPPPLERCLIRFKSTEKTYRRALMLNLVDIVLADQSIEPGEHVGLHQARQILGLSLDESSELHDLAYAVQHAPELASVQRPIQRTTNGDR